MSDANRAPVFRRKRVRSYLRRGQAYAWLRAHYREVVKVLASEECSWAEIAGDMSRDGVEGRKGVSLTADAIRRVWYRVREDVEAAARSAGQPRPGAKYPSRISPSWRPQEVAVPPPPIPFRMPADKPTGALVPVDPAEPVGEEGFTDEERELIAKMRAKAGALFAEHDAKFKV